MGSPERTAPHQTSARISFPGNRIDLAGLHGLLQCHRGQDVSHCLGQRALPRTWRTDHNDIMPSCSCDFQASLRTLLTDDFREIHRTRQSLIFIGCLTFLHFQVITRLFAGQYPQHIIQGINSIHLDGIILYSFKRRHPGQYTSRQSLLGRKFDNRQGAGNLPHPAIQSQLSHYQVFLKKRQIPLTGGGNDSQGNRHIISAALLVHVSRSQVDDDLLARYPEPHRLQRGHCPQKTFLHCSICKSNKMNPDARSYVNLYSYRYGIYPDTLCSMNVYQHIFTYFWLSANLSYADSNVVMKSVFSYKKQKFVTKFALLNLFYTCLKKSSSPSEAISSS